MAIKLNIEETAPIHPTFPPVTNLHKPAAITPSGWKEVSLRRTEGAMKMANIMSAIARFTSR